MKIPRAGVLLASFAFLCAWQPCRADGWKWVAYGDTRTNDQYHREVLAAIAAHTPDRAFIINVGDVVEDGAVDSMWHVWQKACNEILGGTDQGASPPGYIGVAGSHDNVGSDSGLIYWKKYLSGQALRYGHNGVYFTFDYRDARFIILYAENPESAVQEAFLLDVLQRTPKRWLFALWHHPIFDFGGKPYEPVIHQKWGVPLYQHGCDIMFVGHAHYYLRTFKLGLNGDPSPPLDPLHGTVQLVTGNGGAPLAALDENMNGNGYMLAYSYDLQQPGFYGYTEVNMDGDSLRIRHLNTSGVVMDSAVYTPNSDSPLPIQLARLTATRISVSSVIVEWMTLSETNNYGFEVQKSNAPPEFVQVPGSFTPGNGTTSVEHRYVFTDSSGVPGTWYRLVQIDLDGTRHLSDPVAAGDAGGASLPEIPSEPWLGQNYPNPFNPETVISYSIPEEGAVTLRIYDLLGREVATPVRERQRPGSHEVRWDGSNCAGGVYFYVLQTGRGMLAGKMLLLR